MLQKVRNQQTMKILERLRKQGMPSGENTAQPLMGLEEEEQGPGPMEPEEGELGPEGPGTMIVDQTLPGSPALAEARKKLKRRY